MFGMSDGRPGPADLRKHQYYWFALIIFLVIKNRTEGKECNGDKIKQLGRLWYFVPEHTGDERLMGALTAAKLSLRSFLNHIIELSLTSHVASAASLTKH
jgi:hypothetical protein